MAKVIMTCGRICTGKSTYAAKRDDSPAGYIVPLRTEKSRPLSGRLQLQSNKVNHWGVSPMIHYRLQASSNASQMAIMMLATPLESPSL